MGGGEGAHGIRSDPGKFSAHARRAKTGAERIAAAGDVVGGGEYPFARRVHQKSVVPRVIIIVGDRDVEDGTAEHFIDLTFPGRKLPCEIE